MYSIQCTINPTLPLKLGLHCMVFWGKTQTVKEFLGLGVELSGCDIWVEGISCSLSLSPQTDNHSNTIQSGASVIKLMYAEEGREHIPVKLYQSG